MKKRVLLIFTFLLSSFIFNFRTANAYTLGNEIGGLEDLPATITITKAGMAFPTTTGEAYSNSDPLGLYSSDVTHAPALQYISDTGSDFYSRTYVFCMKHGIDGAPTGTVYNKSSLVLHNKVMKIIKNGFGTFASSDGEISLRQAYYITQSAIWAIQGDITVSSTNPFEMYKDYGDNTNEKWQYNMYNGILRLIDIANTPSEDDNNYFVGLYKTTAGNYQDIVPAILHPIKKSTPTTPINPPSPDVPDVIRPKISLVYKDKCTDEFVDGAKMKLVKGNSCSGTTIKSWISGKNLAISVISNEKTESWMSHVFTDIDPGTYTVCDLTNKNSKTIEVKEQEEIQKFEFYTNPLTCEEPKEKNPITGLPSILLICLMIISGGSFYIFIKHQDKFVKIK